MPAARVILSATSVASPASSSIRQSAGWRPFVPGLALRGRRRGGDRFTHEIYSKADDPVRDHPGMPFRIIPVWRSPCP
jgi:hypothetical protein